MEGSMIDLSKYSFQSAKEDLETAELLMKVPFNRTYVKEGVFDKSISKLVDIEYRLRKSRLSGLYCHIKGSGYGTDWKGIIVNTIVLFSSHG